MSSHGGLEVERRLLVQCEEGVSYLGGANPAWGMVTSTLFKNPLPADLCYMGV